MAASYENMEDTRINEGALLKADPASDVVGNQLYRVMENMVTYSDNESFNEMVRLQTASNQFNAGARSINRYLHGQGYKGDCSPSYPCAFRYRSGGTWQQQHHFCGGLR